MQERPLLSLQQCSPGLEDLWQGESVDLFTAFNFFEPFFVHRSLKTGGTEVAREKWDEAVEELVQDDEDEHLVPPGAGHTSPHSKKILPDWTRSAMRPAAPHTARAAR